LAHYVKVKVDVVVGGEDRGGEFSGSEKVTKVGACVAAADAANAVRIDGPLVLRVPRVLD
jgi:hypothetical protein